jgi:hypothetical protein
MLDTAGQRKKRLHPLIPHFFIECCEDLTSTTLSMNSVRFYCSGLDCCAVTVLLKDVKPDPVRRFVTRPPPVAACQLCACLLFELFEFSPGL